MKRDLSSLESNTKTREMPDANMSLRALGDSESSNGSQVETILEVVGKTPTKDGIPVSPANSEGRKRTTPKIANLKATFEGLHSDGVAPIPSSPARFEKRHRDQDSVAVKARDEEIAKLKEQLDAEIELKQDFKEKCSGLEKENKILEANLQRQDGEWRKEMERQSRKLMLERDQSQVEFMDIKRQLLSLKRSISMATRTNTQIPDSSLITEMEHLHFETQHWVVNSFRRVKIDKTPEEMLACLENTVDSRHLDYLRPFFQPWDPALRLVALQAVVTCYTMEVWSDTLLFGLPAWRADVQKAFETMRAILSPSAYSTWRSSTLEALKQSVDIKGSVESATRALTDMISGVLTSLTGVEAPAASPSCPLHAVIKRLVSLSYMFRVQRAEYEFVLPAAGSQFNSASMEAVPPTNGDTSTSIRGAIFPLVLKRGDDSDDAPPPDVVVKAKVLCLT